MGIIISAFPGMGKTLHTTMKTYGLSYSDSDSSKFKWIINDAGEKVVNPDFPNNYVAHIMEAVKTHDIVFVSFNNFGILFLNIFNSSSNVYILYTF